MRTEVNCPQGQERPPWGAGVAIRSPGRKEGDSLGLGHFEGNIPGSGGKAAAGAAAAVALAQLIALAPGRLGQLLRFGLQQLAERFLRRIHHVVEYTAEGCNAEPVPVQEALPGFTEINEDEGLPF